MILAALLLPVALAAPPESRPRTPTPAPTWTPTGTPTAVPTPDPLPTLELGGASGHLMVDGRSVPLQHAYAYRTRGYDRGTLREAPLVVVVLTQDRLPHETFENEAAYHELVKEGKVRGLEVTLTSRGVVQFASIFHEAFVGDREVNGQLLASGRNIFVSRSLSERVVEGTLRGPDTVDPQGHRFGYEVAFRASIRPPRDAGGS